MNRLVWWWFFAVFLIGVDSQEAQGMGVYGEHSGVDLIANAEGHGWAQGCGNYITEEIT